MSEARAHLDYVLGLADDALVSAQRTSWWISRAPQLEEDVALATKALKENVELATKMSELLAERQKLLLEFVKKTKPVGANLDKLLDEQAELKREVEKLKKEIEEIKKEVEKKE